MIFKRKNYDYEVEFDGCVDPGFWSIPLSIGGINITFGNLLDIGCILILRILCFQFSWEIWKWSHEVTDVNYSIEDITNG